MADNKKLAILDSEVAEARMVAKQTAQATVMEAAMGEQLPYVPIEKVNGMGGRQVNLAPSDLGLGNVDNTRDIDKPVSTATQQAMDAMEQLMQGLEDAQEAMRQVVGQLAGQVQAAAAGSAEAQQELADSMTAIQQAMAGLAPLMDAPLAGRPTTPTPDGTVAHQLVNVEFVLAQIQKLIGAAPAALDDLGEIAARFKADEDAVASIVQQLGGKQAASPVLAIYAALSVGLNQLIIGTGNGGLKATDTSALGRQLLAADAPTALQALGAAPVDDARLAGAVRSDVGQSLSAAAQQQARSNIGAGPALGPLLGTPVARTDFALVAVGATPNVYQATDKTRPANIVINVDVNYSVTLASTMADTLELRMGPTAADVTGATAKSFAKIWRSGLTGIAVSVGMGASDGSPVDIMLPAGWYFAIVRKLGTRATIVSAFDQPIG